MNKPCSWSQGEGARAQAVLLRGLPILAANCFRWMGVDVAMGGAWKQATVSTLVTPLALHRVAVALVTDRELLDLKTMVLRAVWGATRFSRAKEVVFVVLTPSHHFPGDAQPLRAGTLDGPDCTHAKTNACPSVGHLGERPPAPEDGTFRACPACGPRAGLAATRGLVVLGTAEPN